MKHNLKACSIDLKELETLAGDRSLWRATCKASVQHFELERVAELKKRSLRKAGGRPTAGVFTCVTCGRICASRIGLCSHRRSHLHPQSASSCRWPVADSVLLRRVSCTFHHSVYQLSVVVLFPSPRPYSGTHCRRMFSHPLHFRSSASV